MALHSVDTIQNWHIYLCPRCNASDPPKDKYVVIVCKHDRCAWGFFINSNIPGFVQNRPQLNVLQVLIRAGDYAFLRYDSHIGCHDLKKFYPVELRTRPLAPVNAATKALVLAAVARATTIEEDFKRRIAEQS